MQAHAQQSYAEQKAAQWQNEPADGQAAATAQPCEPRWHKPSLRVERILMMDYASTQAQAKGVAPTASHEE
jgi:hypothetical protein